MEVSGATEERKYLQSYGRNSWLRLAPQECNPPAVQCPLFMGPNPDSSLRCDVFQFGGDLDPVPINIVHKKKKIISWTVSSGTPLQWNMMRREVVSPISDQRPVSGLEAKMIQTTRICHKHCEAVVFVAATKKGGAQYPSLIDYAIGELKADNVSIEVKQAHGVGTS
jgi:hypothetical protein